MIKKIDPRFVLPLLAGICILIWAQIFLELDGVYNRGFHHLLSTMINFRILLILAVVIGVIVAIRRTEKRRDSSYEWTFPILLGLSILVTMKSLIDAVPILVPLVCYILPLLVLIYTLVFLVPENIKKKILWVLDAKYAGLAIFLMLFVCYSLVGYLITSQKGFNAGDEIFYMCQTESLVEDGDLDLSNNIPGLKFTKKSFRRYHLVLSSRQGKAYSHHPFGVSLLMAPGYALGGRWGAIFMLFFWSSFLGVILLRILKREAENNQIAFFVTLIFSVLLPFSIYAVRSYAELVAAICYLWAFYLIKYNKESSSMRYLLAGIVLGFTYWLLTRRFVIPFAVLNLSALVHCLKTRNMRKFLCLIAPEIVLVAMLLLINNYRFAGNEYFAAGGINNAVLGSNRTLTSVLMHIFSFKFLEPTRLLGALLDKRYGVIWINAFLVLLFPAAIYMTIKDLRRNWEVYTIFWGVYILTCGTNLCAWPAGVCFQPRYALAVLPFLATPCVKLFTEKRQWYKSGGIQIALMLSLISLLALLANPFRFDTSYISYKELSHWNHHLSDFMPWFQSLKFYDGIISLPHIFTVFIMLIALSYLSFSRISARINKTVFFLVVLVATTVIAAIFSDAY